MPIKPVSLAKTVEEKRREVTPYDERPVEEVPDYPYGLTLELSSESLRKLGLNREGALMTDQVFNIAGRVLVTNVSSTKVNTMTEHRATLQVTELGLEPVGDETPRANIMYGNTPNAS